MSGLTKVLILTSPMTLKDIQDFIDEAHALSDDWSAVVKVFGKDLRFKWPNDSPVNEGNLAKGTGKSDEDDE